ncbi:hypothetical protein LTR64_005398 [Lithohypha guttulata]|uniref:uncharacterized protein n=1 Tax=Lithohypha guttulata TaxID=1690604 RepID=UPI002DE18D2E|nr:hypothetical protein LTR51_002809 [Lithohypha guttulata]
MSNTNAQNSLLARHRQLSPTAAVRVSPLCLGSMTFGDKQKERYGECSKDAAYAILDHFYKNGGNFIDTANVYQAGQSEEWLGEWMAARGNRDELVIATKYANVSPSTVDGYEPKTKSNLGGTGTKSMKLALEGSLKRLKTDYVDLYYVHYWDFTVSIPELMHSLNDLVAQGKVLYLGISDTPAWVVSKANQYARDHGLRQFVVYQGMWNATMRDFERDIIPMCQAEGMGLAPYGVLNQGRFQTKKGFEEREKKKEGRNLIPTSERDKSVSVVLEKIAEKKGEQTTLLNVALAYVMQKCPYVFPIVGQRKVEHLQGSMNSIGVLLTEEEVAQVEGAYEFDAGFPHTFLSGTMFAGADARQTGASHASEVSLAKSCGEFDYVQPPKAIRPAGT